MGKVNVCFDMGFCFPLKLISTFNVALFDPFHRTLLWLLRSFAFCTMFSVAAVTMKFPLEDQLSASLSTTKLYDHESQGHQVKTCEIFNCYPKTNRTF